MALVGPASSESSWVIVCMVVSILSRLKSFVCPVLVDAEYFRRSDQARRGPSSYIRPTCMLSLRPGPFTSDVSKHRSAMRMVNERAPDGQSSAALRVSHLGRGGARLCSRITRQSSLWVKSIPRPTSISRSEMKCARTDELVKIREGT